MVNENDFQKALDLINKSDSILITTHTRPDGDACGAVAALTDYLTTLGKKVKSIFLSEIPQWYEFLFEQKPAVIDGDVSQQQLEKGQFGEFDLIIIVDTNTYNQLKKITQYLKQANKPVLVIDHHLTSDNIGDVELIDTGAAAVALIVFDLLKYANQIITQKVAQALFVGIAADTGWFQFNNTDSRVHRSCAELIDAGVNSTQIYHQLYQNFSSARFKLMIMMLNSLQLHLDGRFATQNLSLKHFEQTGAKYSDTENLIDECRRLSSVEASALFVELKDGRVKCSLRSKGEIDVCKIATKFDGGGHKLAAGAIITGSLENAQQLITTEMAEQFENLNI